MLLRGDTTEFGDSVDLMGNALEKGHLHFFDDRADEASLPKNAPNKLPDGGFYVYASDPAKTIFLEVAMNSLSFSEFEVDGYTKMGGRFPKLQETLARVRTDDFEMEVDEGWPFVRSTDGRFERKMAMPGVDNIDATSETNFEYAVEVEVAIGELEQAISSVELVSDGIELHLEKDGDGMTLVAVGEGDTDTIREEVTHWIPEGDAPELTTEFGKDVLRGKLTKHIPSDQTFTFSFIYDLGKGEGVKGGPNYPMKVEGALNESTEIRAILSPRDPS